MSEYFEIGYSAVAKRLCLFTGTGFSKALSENNIPGWQELLEKVCDEYIDTPLFKEALFPADGPNPLSLEEAAQVIDIELAKTDRAVHAVIADIISDIDISGSFPQISKFLKESSYRVVTTNYDKLLEKVADTDCQSLCPGLPVPRSNSRVKVFHIHGSVDVPNRMIVTSDNYFGFMNATSYFSKKLSTVLHENTVVILGYSLGDANLKTILSDYKGFVQTHRVSNSIFLVARSAVDQRIKDYYSNCYGIRVIDNTEVEDFFEKLNVAIVDAENSHESSIVNINKVLYEGKRFTAKYLGVESSFYEIIASIGAVGASLDDERVVEVLGSIVNDKKELTQQTGAWDQYSQLASWLTYLGTLIDVRGSSIEEVYLDAVKYSMEHMSKKLLLGYSWQAYRTWESRWSSVSASNRKLISNYITANTADGDALRIVSAQ